MVDLRKSIPKLVPAKASIALEADTLCIKCLPSTEYPIKSILTNYNFVKEKMFHVKHQQRKGERGKHKAEEREKLQRSEKNKREERKEALIHKNC